MFFEGSEKKAEIIIDATQISLIADLEENFWQALVQCCNAKILSTIENKDCKAFLLSESSLFVWHDRLLIITCGNTRLVHSVEYFIQQVGMSKIQQITYQRKNEYFAHAQLSSFGDDIALLGQYVKGQSFRFGELDGHHNYIFNQDTHFKLNQEDKSYELIAYQICQKASDKLTTLGLAANEIREFLQLDRLLAGYILDDFVFEPFGYSINAIKGMHYLTIHITPQASSSYVSIQANINLIALAPDFLRILAPKSIDLLSVNETYFSELTRQYLPQEYISKSLFQQHLSNNDLVSFANYILPQTVFNQAELLDVDDVSHTL
ncbi:adenosylmethionine decarboxylase [Colwellia sp. 6M3]|uniref:adenosylmethionine decarboxylase n=1 Tax=Colwellia sp. 6M3 TaxID=2759849 RepID=UPI0015F73CD8|nr:adenosylmethionine decarboxylase [Colwellia sp. 6M3]MBA6415061.1 adenosylmethionine decarboxylase [Colwellia sp. 6M3]